MRFKRLLFALLLFSALLSFHRSAFGQERREFCVQHVGITSLLDSLGKVYGIDFSFSPQLFRNDSIVSVCGSFSDAGQVLIRIVDTAYVDIIKIENQYILKEKRSSVAPSLIRISGSVVDSGSGVPLQSVHVSVVGGAVGTVTNNAGQYQLVVPYNDRRLMLGFSLIGYESATVGLEAGECVADVRLASADIRLPEVKVVYSKAEDVLANFFKNVDNNYSQSPSVLSCFFRESVFQDKKLVQISEAVVDVFKSRYSDRESYERVDFVRGRKSRPPHVMTDLVFKLEGGPYYLARIDLAKYWDFLPQPNMDSNYSFVFDGVDYEYGKLLFKLAFEPVRDDGDLKYSGFIYFDSESFALVRAEFELTRKSLINSRRQLIRKESKNVDARLVTARYSVVYRPIGGKWILGSVAGVLQVKVKSRSRDFSGLFTASSELVVNDVNPIIRLGNLHSATFRPNYQIYEQIKEFDPQFWDTCNIILPDIVAE